MKKMYALSFFLLTFSAIVFLPRQISAQAPQGFKYQAVVRDNAGGILQNQAVGIWIAIHDATATGTTVYQETFSETTNQFGLVTIEIGNGTPGLGVFENIDWGNNPKFLQVAIDPTGGTTYFSVGTSELLSVPYALYSGATGDTSTWRKNGNNIYFGSGNVGIGKTAPQKRLHVYNASSGYNDPVAIFESGTHTRIDIRGPGTDKSIGLQFSDPSDPWKGGIGLNETNNNIEFATDANGSSPRMIITDGGNVAIGTSNPLSKLSVGGDGSNLATIYGHSSGAYDFSIYGHASGTGGRGVYGLATNTGDVYNTGVYGEAKGTYGKGVYGVVSGNEAKGVYGYATGAYGYGVYGETTTADGYGIYGRADFGGVAVQGVANGNGLGVAGWSQNTTGTYGASDYGNGLKGSSFYGNAIYGESWYENGIYGKAHDHYKSGVIGDGSYGNSYDFFAIGSGIDYGSPSSLRWKKNITEIDKPLEKLAQIRGVYFDWDEKHGGKHDVGCIAEEVGKVLPEIVIFEENGTDVNGMDYSKLAPLLIEAIKAQQRKIEDLESRIAKLELTNK
ncbi:MAG: tail fiber domain-containing protein [Chlorobi bacterium]|nr:tail fiber domain-containing protein [Chlorobiota bacterium]